MKKKIVWIFGILALLLIAGIITFSSKSNVNSSHEFTTVQEIDGDDEGIRKIENVEERFKDVSTFIEERLPITGLTFQYNLSDHPGDSSTEELKKELFDLFYLAIKKQDMDTFLSVISGQSVEEIWSDEIKIESRIKLIEVVLSNISRNGLFESIGYQFEKNKYDQVTDKGVLYLYYSDGLKVQVPIEVELIDAYGDEERFYRFVTTIKEIERSVLNQN